MPFPCYVEFKHPRQEIKGTAKAIGKENLIVGVAFETQILDEYTVESMPPEELKRLGVYMGFTPMKLTVDAGPFIPHLYNAVCRGEELTEVTFYWPTVNPKSHKEHVYLQQRIYPVKITKVEMGFPNVKDKRYVRYPHLVDIWFRYRWLETLFVKGYIITKVEWPCFYTEHLSGKDAKELEEILKGDAITDHEDFTPKSSAEILAGIGLWSPAWVHKDDGLKEESPKEAAEGETIQLSCDVDGLHNGDGVTFEIEYTEPKGNPIQFASASGAVKDGIATGEWTVDLEKLKKKKIEVDKLTFVPSARSKPGSRVEIPLRKPVPPGVPVALFEYPNISSAVDLRNKAAIPQPFFKKLLDGKSHLAEMNKHHPVLLDGKWVYVFRKSGSSASLVYEVKPSVSCEAQEYEYVSWKQENVESNRNTFPRKVAGSKLKGLKLTPDNEYYLLVSQEMLPLHRIDFYTQNPDQLAKRAVCTKVEKQKTEEPLQINLVDFVGICFELVEEKNKAVSKYTEYFGNEGESTKRYLANMVSAIETNRPAIRKWLDFNAVTTYKNREELRTKRLVHAKDNCTGRLKDWKLSEGYKLARDDYNGTEELEKKILEIESQVTAEDEVEYLATIGKDETSWYRKVFLDDEPFFFTRKLFNFGAFDALPDLLSKYFIGRFLASSQSTSLTVSIDGVLQDFEATLRKLDIDLSTLHKQADGNFFTVGFRKGTPRVKYLLAGAHNSRANIDFIDGRSYDKAISEWQSGIEKTSIACKSILLVVETMNLVGSARSAFDSVAHGRESRAFDSIDAIGSLADAIAATDFLVERKLASLLKVNKATKVFPMINLAGSICDYIGALKNCYIASSEEKMSLAMAHSVVGLAAGAGMAYSALSITGGGAAAAGMTGGGAATALGISATGWGLIAVGLALTGATLVWVFTEEDLEEWAKESEWTKDSQRKLPLATQARNINEILCQFKVECYILRQVIGSTLTNQGTFASYSNELKLQITPGMLYADKSKFNVVLNVADDDGLILNTIFGKQVMLDKKLELPDAQTQVIPVNGKKPGAIRRYFSKEEFKNQPDFLYDKLVYKCDVYLDLNGDGSDMYPKKGNPLELKGRVQARMRDEG